jgi:hypothetical protein
MLGDRPRREQESVQCGGPGVIDQEVDPSGLGDQGDSGTSGGFIGYVNGMRGEIRVRQRLRATGESMYSPAIGEQPFSESKAKALGSASDKSGGHFV